MANIVRTLLVSFFCLTCSLVVEAQTKDLLIKNIKTDFQKINSDKSLKLTKLKNDQFLEQTTDGGGILNGYFKADTIYKITVSVGLSFGIQEYEYYLKNNQLFFVYETEKSFSNNSVTRSINYSKLLTAFEGRYYFHQDKLIEVKKKGKKRFEETTPVPTKEMLADVRKYTKLLKLHLRSTNP